MPEFYAGSEFHLSSLNHGRASADGVRGIRAAGQCDRGYRHESQTFELQQIHSASPFAIDMARCSKSGARTLASVWIIPALTLSGIRKNEPGASEKYESRMRRRCASRESKSPCVQARFVSL